ncbi:MAG: hypothetical protein SH821_12170 [Phototrophicales bacterium]|nr:hypothetical protein [Phototrophicales bacterium]
MSEQSQHPLNGDDPIENPLHQATVATVARLRQVFTDPQIRNLSRLPLPEIERLSEELAQTVPAGNVPGMILNALAKLDKREISQNESQKYVQLLFRGIQTTVGRMVYSALFVPPAAVIHGYQQLLRLSGKDMNAAFPDGTWQFYLEFALREDSARHTNETIGFHTHMPHLRPEDTLAAWLMTSVQFLKLLPSILENEWRERILTKLMVELGKGRVPEDIYSRWEKVRPFGREKITDEDFPQYRRKKFDEFIVPYIRSLDEVAKRELAIAFKTAGERDLASYQYQLSWLANLEPNNYNEIRTHYPLKEAYIGVIRHGRYHLIPMEVLLRPQMAHTAAQTILHMPPQPMLPMVDEIFVVTPRALHQTLYEQLDPSTQKELALLKKTPIIINWDERDSAYPLTWIRRGKRGCGDHPLTITKTQSSFIFDQSHIFFDGAWGAAVSEMMTREAVNWGMYFSAVKPQSALAPKLNIQSLTLKQNSQFAKLAQKSRLSDETGAENHEVKLSTIQSLRQLLLQRLGARVTVNDLMIIYRGFHALNYKPSEQMNYILNLLKTNHDPRHKQAYKLAMEQLQALVGKNPAMLLPIDASRHNPKERLFPTTFRNPITDLHISHQRTLDLLRAYYMASQRDKMTSYQQFNDQRAYYLRVIGGLGELLARYREIALSGKSSSTAGIQMLAHVPPVLQKLLNALPNRFDVLNEILKGEEVFSNLGRVAKGSSLRRFITAKDDNKQKTLAWGAITDDIGVIHLSLRDFRPHVTALHDLDLYDFAQYMTQDYLDSYAHGLNTFIAELIQIVVVQ